LKVTIFTKDCDEDVEPTAFGIKDKAVVLLAQVNLCEKLVVVSTKKDVLNSMKDILLTQDTRVELA
jgi:hypothetical protein